MTSWNFGISFCGLSNPFLVAEWEQVGIISAVKGALVDSSIFFAAAI